MGQSVDIYRRWYEHQNPHSWKAQKSKVLYRAFIKYGIENFTFEVVEECKRNKLDSREQYWIKKLKSYSNGYNMTKGGQGHRDYKFGRGNRKKLDSGWYDEFVSFLGMFYPDIYGTFENMKQAVCPYVENLEEIDDADIINEIDGYDTLMRDFYGGYDNFEQWAECNLI